jgi:hypothetical protein
MNDRLKLLFALYDSIVEKKETRMTLIKSNGKPYVNNFNLKSLNKHIINNQEPT